MISEGDADALAGMQGTSSAPPRIEGDVDAAIGLDGIGASPGGVEITFVPPFVTFDDLTFFFDDLVHTFDDLGERIVTVTGIEDKATVLVGVESG